MKSPNEKTQWLERYKQLYHDIEDIKKKLDNLHRKKDDPVIDKDRYEQQEREYKEFLEQNTPELKELKAKITSKIDELIIELEDTEKRLTSVKKLIDQEKTLYEAGAISKDQYTTKVTPLKTEEKGLQSKFNDQKKQIDLLKSTIKGEPLPPPGHRGERHTNNGHDNEKSKMVAAFLNWFWSGAGNIYIGQTTKGLFFSVFTLIIVYIDIITCSFGLIIHVPYMVIMIIDAALLTDRIRKGETISDWQFF